LGCWHETNLDTGARTDEERRMKVRKTGNEIDPRRSASVTPAYPSRAHRTVSSGSESVYLILSTRRMDFYFTILGVGVALS